MISRLDQEVLQSVRDRAFPYLPHPHTERDWRTVGTYTLDGRKDRWVVGRRTVREMDTRMNAFIN